MSLELEEIVIENFGTIEHIKLVLNTPGMILITGLNKDAPKSDSNGAGKSLLLDAICWVLWGETVRGLTTDDVVRRQVGQDCCVSLKMSEGKTNYVVTRHRKDTRVDKPNDLRLFINGVEKGKKVKNLQELIDQLIGFDFDTFCAMMPGAGINAASLTDGKIKELLEKLLQTEQLSSAYTAARDRLKVLESEQSTVSAKIWAVFNGLTDLDREVAQLRDLEKSFLSKKAENAAALQRRIDELSAELAGYDAALAREPLLKQQTQAAHTQWLALKDEHSKLGQARWPIAQAQERAVNDAILTARQLDEKVKALREELRIFGSIGPSCALCKQRVDGKHSSAHAEALGQKYIAARSACAAAGAEVERLRAVMNADTQATYDAQTLLVAPMDSLKSEMQRIDSELLTLEATTMVRMRCVSELNKAKVAQVAALAESHNFAEIFASKAAQVKQLVQDVCQCLTKQRELEKEEKLCRFWVEGFSPAGLRSYMLDYVTPILNDRAAYYSEVLTGGEMKVVFTTKTTLKKGGEKDKFQIIVEQKHGGDLYKGTSKGEKARADLVIAMALGDLATFRTAKQLPWRFLDEPFENIDDTGNEAVVQLLNDQKSRYKTVFVVTHKPAFKKLFSQRITVVKENGVSRLEHG